MAFVAKDNIYNVAKIVGVATVHIHNKQKTINTGSNQQVVNFNTLFPFTLSVCMQSSMRQSF